MTTTTLWYLSVHGGSDSGNNLLSFDTTGRLVSARVLDDNAVALRELRGFHVLPDGRLLVANAHKGEGKILQFAAAASPTAPRTYQGAFCVFDPGHNPGLLHPFNLRVGPDGNLYVSNQGSSNDPSSTNGVTRYGGPGTSDAGEPLAIPPYWREHAEEHLFPGTAIPANKRAQHGVKRIRDLLFARDGFLYVADEKRNEVRRYDGATFEYLERIVSKDDGLKTPVHLLLSDDKKHLYIGSEKNDSVLRYHFKTGAVETFVESGAAGLHAPAGLAMDGTWLYVCSRKSREVLRYRLSDGLPDSEPFITSEELFKGSSDDPEFILQVKVPGRSAYASGTHNVKEP
ncbi:MAG TPA: beta-propeller fold lactonase family protein [Thermoanaerobaculia bacterium]|nr:beta-propeller fold lactonase family protein [Thermoanaerobaculia bacterium]